MKLQTQLIHTLKMPICEFIRKRNDMSNNRKCIGRLAGLYYGIDGIPKGWIDIIPKKEWIIELAERM